MGVVQTDMAQQVGSGAQLLVQTLGGQTVPLEIPLNDCAVDTSFSIASLVRLIVDAHGVPAELLRLTSGTKELRSGQSVSVHELQSMPVRMLLGISGGKGGFGAMLRNLGKNIDTKNMNYDACRDLSGRRLRHVQNDKQLQDWYAHEDDRAEESRRDKEEAKRSLKQQRGEVMREFLDHEHHTLVEETNQLTEDLPNAVLQGLKAKKNKKLKPEPTEEPAPAEENSEGAAAEVDVSLKRSLEEVTEAAAEAAAEAVTEAPIEPPVLKKKKVEEQVCDPIELQQVPSLEALAQFNSASLTQECKRRGLKAGGVLKEKAARLWMVRGPPELKGEEIPFKLRAVPAKKK